MDRYGPAVLRLVVGATFMAHGAQHLFGVWGGSGLAGTAASFESIGLSPGYPLAVAVAVTESLGGLLLMAGALTPGQGHGIEYNVLLIAALVCLIFTGPGAFSIEHRRARSAESYAAGRARLRWKP